MKRRAALVFLGTFAVLVTACTNDPAHQAVPTTSKPARTHPVSGGVSPTTAVASSLRPAGCQSKWVSQGSGSSLNPDPRNGSSTELVPPEPGVMTVCRYAGLNQKVAVGTLEAFRVVKGVVLSAFVKYLDQKSWRVIKKGAVFDCPMDQGSIDLLEFVYPSGPDVTVSVGIEGCTLVSNGDFTIWGDAIGDRVGAWVGADVMPQA